jgi:hypothetical protein
MASYPSAKVHRVSRRQLGRGQHVQVAQATVSASASTVTVTLTFNVPVVVNGVIALNLGTPETFVSQTQISPTQVHQVYAASVAGSTWSIHAGAPVSTYQGGGLAPASGTF